MRLTVYILCVSLAVVISPIWIIAGEMKIWTDENGVTHIEYQKQRSAYDYEELKQEYEDEKEKRKRLRQIEREKRENKSNRIMEEYNQKIKRLERKIERDIADDRKKMERERAKRRIELEIKQAKRNYEFEKSQKLNYEQYYRNASSSKYRKHWKEKLDGIDEARKKYEDLQHQRFRNEN